MTDGNPKWRRRKAHRPVEIIASALEEFAERGYAQARLDEIAARAGITKAALYRYFDTKEALFRAVARTAMAPNLEALSSADADPDEPLVELLPAWLERIAQVVSGSRLPAVVRLVIGESRTFPDLAAIWHETVVAPMLATLERLIARAQQRGEIRNGQARVLAVSLAGPLLMGLLLREVFAGVAKDTIDLETLAHEHARVFLGGVLVRPGPTDGEAS